MEDLTREQILFLEAEGRVIVRACPGSGKTYSVANKLLSYVDNWNSYHQGVAVLSFTNVASEEIYKKAFGALTILNPDISNHQDHHQNICFVKYDSLQR